MRKKESVIVVGAGVTKAYAALSSLTGVVQVEGRGDVTKGGADVLASLIVDSATARRWGALLGRRVEVTVRVVEEP